MSHIYENDTKPILSDPPYLLQFILAVVLSVLCGATIIVTTRVNTNPGPFWNRWIIAITYALLTLFSGWLLHFFM